jgi:hypothetical protein
LLLVQQRVLLRRRLRRRVWGVRRMKTATHAWGLGLGWRPELALPIARHGGLGFVEIVAENVDPGAIPKPVEQLRARGVAVIRTASAFRWAAPKARTCAG